MEEKFITKSKNKPSIELLHQRKAQAYLEKYVQELKVHFNLSDSNLHKILGRTQGTLKAANPIQNWLRMLNLWED